MKRIHIWALAALLAVLAAYTNSFGNAFHFDDFHTIVDNPAIRSLSNVPRFFTDATTFSVLPANRTYRPTVSTSLAFDYALAHGYVPFWFHLSTFVVFLLLLFLLWRLYSGIMAVSSGPAGFTNSSDSNLLWALGAAAWFGLHPAMAETVNYIIQRGDIYCTIGCVGALALWAEWPRARRWGLYLLPLAFALLSKPPAAVFPALLLLYVFFFEAEGTSAARWKRSLAVIVPSLLVTAALMLLQAHMTPKTFAPSILSSADYRMTQPLVWLRYFGELFLPLHLNVDTDLPAYAHINAAVLAGFAFVLLLVIALWFTSRRRTLYPVAFGLAWFVITELPTSLYPLSEVENDHRMFFSFVGLMLAVVWTLRLLMARATQRSSLTWLRPIAVTCALLAFSGYAWGVHLRNRVWHTEASLWADDVAKSPHNGRGLMNYGLILMNRGDYPGALALFNRALQFTPNYATLEINLGIVNGAMGREREAEHHFLRALALAPTDDTPHTFYGRWLLQQGRLQEAVAQLREAVSLNPARPMQHDLLLAALQRMGDSAATEGSTAMNADAWINRSLALNQAGRYQESIAAAQQALKINPRSPKAWNNIAAGNEALHRWDAAIAAARKAISLKPDFQLAKNNLAWSEAQKDAGR